MTLYSMNGSNDKRSEYFAVFVQRDPRIFIQFSLLLHSANQLGERQEN